MNMTHDARREAHRALNNYLLEDDYERAVGFAKDFGGDDWESLLDEAVMIAGYGEE